MDIRQLEYFIVLAEQKNFSRAAKQLFLTQPSLTRCIKKLEASLEVKLIERTSKSFRLTDAGQQLYHYGTSLISQFQDLNSRISDTKNLKSGSVRISSPGVLLDMYFPAILTKFRTENPGIDIELAEAGSKPAAQWVLNGDVDIGLVMLPVPNQQEFDVIPLLQDEVRLLVRQDHPLAFKSAVHINDLRDMDIISYNSGTTLLDTFIQLCENCGFTPHIAYKCLMPFFIVETISLSSCVGVLPYPMIQHLIQHYELDNLTSVRITPSFPWDIAMILKKDRYHSYATEKLQQHIQCYFAQL